MWFITKLLPLILLSLFVSPVFKANAQTYLPVGPQTNVPEGTVTDGGWVECYSDTYDVPMDADAVLDVCDGDLLMLTCRETGSSTIALLAQGERSDVIFDTGNTQDLHIANGVGWYFDNDSLGSWGFVRAGDTVSKNNCDTDASGANDERLCWHLNDFGGYRCGSVENLNESNSYERVIYVASELPPPPPPSVTTVPTLSEWGLIAMAGFMGIAGLLVMRRRKLTA
jgi:hypothetical protein